MTKAKVKSKAKKGSSDLNPHPPPMYKRATPFRHMSGAPKPLRIFAMICGLVVDTLIIRTWVKNDWVIHTSDWLVVLIFIGATYIIFPDEINDYIDNITEMISARFSKGSQSNDSKSESGRGSRD